MRELFVRTLSRRKIHDAMSVILLFVVAFCLLYRPQAAANGVRRGLSVCSTVLIPTLYPFMLVAGWLTDSPLCRRPAKWACTLTRRLFGLPGCCGAAILIGLVGGYPAGAIAAGRLYRQGMIDAGQRERMSRFCVNAGPGFIIGTVGAGLLGNTRAGVLLFAAQVTASVLLGVLSGRGRRVREDTTLPVLSPKRSFAALVGDTCLALLTTCGWVVSATAVLSVADALGIPAQIARLGLPVGTVRGILAGLTEVSGGCMAAVGATGLTPVALGLCLGWGGLAVHGQVFAALGEDFRPGAQFWLYRLIHGVIGAGVAALLFRFIPVGNATAVAAPVFEPTAATANASTMLLATTFCAMLCFSAKKTGKTHNDVL